ncbi:MAG TPA: DUF898 family protein [Candidatus Saccharimonadales bacterium]|nr:DUF898 family protein [Candidatus Saccharimonadales bacterium]
MSKSKFEFRGKAGGYFVVFLVTAITAYIPIFGWPVSMNYAISWIADNSLIEGRKIRYTAKYGETLKFLLINLLLLIVTLGIYTFWFVPKQYRFIANRIQFVD